MSEKKLRLGIPIGSLMDSTIRIFGRAGYKINANERNYSPSVDDPNIEVTLIRAQEMSRYVEHGEIDLGLTGLDWILENKSKIVEVADLPYTKKRLGKVKWVLAVPANSSIKSVKDLEGKRVSTELVEVTKDYFKKKGVNAKIEFSWGATEAKAPKLVDAIVELTETGTSLKANNLETIDVVFESTTKLIANENSMKDPWKKQKINDLALLLKGAIAAEELVGVMMNVPSKKLDSVLKVLPAMKSPTVSKLAGIGWYDVFTVVREDVIRELIPKLKEAGAQGIIEFSLNKAVE